MEFVDKVKDLFGKSAESTKQAVNKAGSAIQDFSDKSVLKFDIKKLEGDRKSVCSELGEYVFDSLSTSDSVNKTDEKVSEIISRICQIDEKIAEKEKALAEFSPKDE